MGTVLWGRVWFWEPKPNGVSVSCVLIFCYWLSVCVVCCCFRRILTYLCREILKLFFVYFLTISTDVDIGGVLIGKTPTCLTFLQASRSKEIKTVSSNILRDNLFLSFFNPIWNYIVHTCPNDHLGFWSIFEFIYISTYFKVHLFVHS